MTRLDTLEQAVRLLVKLNTTLSYRLALVETGNKEEARQVATVATLRALAALEGFTADTLPEARFEEILAQVDAEFDGTGGGARRERPHL